MRESASILIVDDDKNTAEAVARALRRFGYACRIEQDGASGLRSLQDDHFDVALIDLVMPGMDGMSVLADMSVRQIGTVPIVFSSYGDVTQAVEAMQLGAFDFVEKPTEIARLDHVIQRALAHRRLVQSSQLSQALLQEWEAIFDAYPDLIAIVDVHYRIIRVNRAMAGALGCEPDDLVGKPCCECIHRRDEPFPSCPVRQTFTDSSHHTFEFHDERLGGHFLVSTTPVYAATGSLTGAVCVARNVTEQKRIEAELRKAHSEAERLLSTLSSFLIGMDDSFRVTRWNAAAEDTFGLSAKEVRGKLLKELPISWDLMEQFDVSGWRQQDEPLRLPHVHFTRPDARQGILGITFHPVKGEDGLPAGFFLLGADISQRLNLEAQLVHAQKLESIGQLAAGIAHEINTPTQYVGDNIEFLSFALEQLGKLRAAYEELVAAARNHSVTQAQIDRIETLKTDCDIAYLDEQIPQAIQQAREGVNRVAAIVQAMKEFSHPGAKEKTRVDLNRCIENTVTVSRNEWKYVAELTTEFDASLPPVNCLPDEFNQVILNIIVNAAHAIKDVVGDGSEGKGRITITTRRDGDWADVRISDTGRGIPKEIHNRIFDPFFTTKEVGKGTGQGLAIARNVIVEKHKGSLTFETKEGEGTTFIIRIPIDGEQQDEPAP